MVTAIAASGVVATARTETGKLIGLARVITDGATIVFLQDILVHPDHQRTGTGRALVTAVLEPFAGVRQQVLITDDEPGQRAFYESLGFTKLHNMNLRGFYRTP